MGEDVGIWADLNKGPDFSVTHYGNYGYCSLRDSDNEHTLPDTRLVTKHTSAHWLWKFMPVLFDLI